LSSPHQIPVVGGPASGEPASVVVPLDPPEDEPPDEDVDPPPDDDDELELLLPGRPELPPPEVEPFEPDGSPPLGTVPNSDEPGAAKSSDSFAPPHAAKTAIEEATAASTRMRFMGVPED
jgi:hypothetical protein